MPKHGKKYSDIAKSYDLTQVYEVEEALALVKKNAKAKFDETIEVAVRLNLDPRQSDQQIRGAVVLPNGTGVTRRVLVFAKGDKVKEAEAAGADFVGSEELVTKIQGGWFWSSILYPGFNAVVVIILSCSMGRFANSSKEAFRGGLFGGILFGAAILAMNLGLLANIEAVFDKSVPTLVLADAISPIIGIVFSVIICCGIYTTTVPMLWGVTRHFAQDGTKKFVLIALGLTALGLLLGMTNFKTLVNIIYPFSGYAGVILFGFIAWREVQGVRAKQKHRKTTQKSQVHLESLRYR